jgi:hypothetical protein
VSGTLGKAPITLGKGHSAAISSAKTSQKALGKGFAECQKIVGKEKHSAKYKSKKIQKNETEKNEFIGEACTSN